MWKIVRRAGAWVGGLRERLRQRRANELVLHNHGLVRFDSQGVRCRWDWSGVSHLCRETLDRLPPELRADWMAQAASEEEAQAASMRATLTPDLPMAASKAVRSAVDFTARPEIRKAKVIRRVWERIVLSHLTIDEAFRDAPPKRVASLSWDEVRKVAAFKVDALVVDQIRLALEGSSTVLEIDEEMFGWSALIQALTDHLPGIRTEWWTDVAFPPFESCVTVLFERPSTSR